MGHVAQLCFSIKTNALRGKADPQGLDKFSERDAKPLRNRQASF
ncbi:MAG: hypothetical protein JWQ87_4952 [Candidatus Sulfotelmatobacter sp.]|nr:hypothetical protein [Candidatus Sulfotelmatobacter sp.]